MLSCVFCVYYCALSLFVHCVVMWCRDVVCALLCVVVFGCVLLLCVGVCWGVVWCCVVVLGFVMLVCRCVLSYVVVLCVC